MKKQITDQQRKQIVASISWKSCDFSEMPQGAFETLCRTLVNNDNWADMQMKRNKLFRAMKQAYQLQNPSQFGALNKQMEAHDQKMAMMLYCSVFNFLTSYYKGKDARNVSLDDMEKQLSEDKQKMLHHYRDLTTKAFFLLDIVDGYLSDAMSTLNDVVEGKDVSTSEYDDIKQMVQIVQSHNFQCRRYQHQEINDLSNGFIDTIQAFVDEQLNIYNTVLDGLVEELQRRGELKAGSKSLDKNKLLDR